MSQEDTQEIDVGEPIYQCPDCGSLTIRGKWSIEGARTLTDAALMLRDYAHELEHMRFGPRARRPGRGRLRNRSTRWCFAGRRHGG